MTTGEEVWKVYLAKCSDGSLYCGISKDVPARISKHNAGKGAKYTQSRRPVKLAAVSREMSKSDALKLEYSVKKQPAKDKLKVLKGQKEKNISFEGHNTKGCI